jgi:4-carboxymuconolactone decarboxylase
VTPAQAALVRVSAAAATGAPAEVAAQARAAIEAGAGATPLYETVLQCYLFLGFPRAIEALFAVAPVLAEARGVPAGGEGVAAPGGGAVPAGAAAPGSAAPFEPERWRRDGDALCRRVYGRNYEKLVRTIGELSPDLAEWMIVEGYGKTLSRPGLGTIEREYAVVAILTATRMWRQLRSHAIGAVNVGGTRADVKEAILLSEPWSGAAAVREALAVTGLA